MEFSEVYRKFASDIRITALSQKVPTLDYDDIVSEMMACLWKAWLTYSPGSTTFGSYWWSIWLNRRADLTSQANAYKRPKHVLIPDLTILPKHPAYTMARWPEAPSEAEELEEIVWNLIASGEPRSVVIEKTGVSKRRYYEIISRWRSEEVESRLRATP